ncbi:polyprenyl P-hydroxybenzoate and phenylacrylic acid decarboxylase family protein, partial [Vibrio parahaemolyticus V-223/04]
KNAGNCCSWFVKRHFQRYIWRTCTSYRKWASPSCQRPRASTISQRALKT